MFLSKLEAEIQAATANTQQCEYILGELYLSD